MIISHLTGTDKYLQTHTYTHTQDSWTHPLSPGGVAEEENEEEEVVVVKEVGEVWMEVGPRGG